MIMIWSFPVQEVDSACPFPGTAQMIITHSQAVTVSSRQKAVSSASPVVSKVTRTNATAKTELPREPAAVHVSGSTICLSFL